jgi:integrase
MRGSIRERSPRRWAIILEQTDAATGQRKRKWHSFAGTKRQAQIECARLISAMKGGTYLEPDKATLAVFLDRWIDHIKSQVSPRSHERYEEIARKNIVPLLGGVILNKLRPAQIAAAYTTALTSGRRKGGGGLAPRTVHHIHRVLKQALGQAVRWEILHRNPCDAVDPPKVERKPMHTYDLHQTAMLIEAMRGRRLLVPALLAALCGLRRGEIAALRWRAVDLDAGAMSVAESVEQLKKRAIRLKPPKAGARTVSLPATIVQELRAHRIALAQEMLLLGKRLMAYDFVCLHADGSMMEPVWITQEWIRTKQKLNLPQIRFHDLRHAHATHMLASGVHPKIASERLGHSKIGITLDLYSHVMPGMQEGAAAQVDAALQKAIAKIKG